MEEFKQFCITNWPTILEYTLMFLAYFLVFLYRGKVSGTRRDLTLLFKEKSAIITKTDTDLRKDVHDVEEKMKRELVEAKERYNAAVDKIARLEKNLIRLEQVILLLVDDPEVENDEKT